MGECYMQRAVTRRVPGPPLCAPTWRNDGGKGPAPIDEGKGAICLLALFVYTDEWRGEGCIPCRPHPVPSSCALMVSCTQYPVPLLHTV